MLVNVGRGESSAAKAGLGGGGGGFASEPLQGARHEHLARPATSDEVRRISIACGEFRPRRLKQNPVVAWVCGCMNIQKCLISGARGVIFDIFWRPGGARRAT